MSRVLVAVVVSLAMGILEQHRTALGADEPQVSEALNAQGHTAKVWKVLFTRDGLGLITASEDKTVRIWDLATGTPRRTFRLPGAGGKEGQAYAAALSPDGQTLAVGGYGLSGGLHFIYLVSLTGEETVRVLNGHTDVIDALAFSPDGKRLLSGSHDQTARLWDLETRQPEHILNGHEGEVYSVAFSPEGHRAVTAAFDRTAIVWDLASGKQIAPLKGHAAEVRCAAWSADGMTIATGAEDDTIRLWEPDGKPRKAFENLGKRTITSLAFAHDGRLLFTQGYGEGPRKCGILDCGTGNVTASFEGHSGLVLDGVLSRDAKLAATVGGENYEAILWRTDNGQPVQTFASPARSVWAAAWSADGSRIAWGNKNEGKTLAADMPLERTFDLKAFALGGAPDATYVRGKLKDDHMQVAGFEDGAVEFQPKLGSIVRIELKDGADPDPLNCLALLPNDRVALATETGLSLYDLKTGKKIRDLQGHTGRVRALSASPNGKYLLSGSDDMTLRIWDQERETPLLSLLVTADDWLAWTPEGYYHSSAGGESLTGWRTDNGLSKLATFSPASQFHKSLFRPDVMARLLDLGSVEKAVAAIGTAPYVNVLQALPPAVQITALEKADPNSPELTIEAQAVRQGATPIVSMQVLLDGRPLKGRAGRVDFDKPAAQIRQNFVVPLTAGVAHELIVRADTPHAHGLSLPATYTFKPDEPLKKPNLHVLAIGISTYQAGGYRRDGAAPDVQAVAQALEKQSAAMYGQVVSKTIVDADATRAGLLGGLSGLRKQSTPRDTVVVYISALAQNEETGGYFVLPTDTDPASLIVTAIPDSQIKSMLQGVPGRVVVLLDTPAPTAEGMTPQVVVDDIVRDLAHDDLGVTVVALGRAAQQPMAGAGPFAAAVLEALSLSNDADGELYSTELASRVRGKLAGQGLPVSIGIPSVVRPFVILAKP